MDTFTPDPDRLQKADVRAAINALIKRREDHGDNAAGPGEGEHPLVYGAFLLLQHIHQTHPKGIRGTLQAIRWITTELFRLDEE